ncbi:homer protein homolog 2-like isoform X2 [Ornithodoros turicata]|uniref:homer protein homolog 2-like isoform X2 n=1 Tax=Ornithodoros turicata TaxID=34597 RepID=UPI0031393A4F
MTANSASMGEQPIFSTKAHVFHIDPKTKRSWIPASSQAVSVSFFYDSTRNLYRIISVEGTKAVINSTITPNMTFTKTSQKFGQWSDIRANTVYGLGFGTEPDLNKFIEKFQEVKEATRAAAAASAAAAGGQQKANGSVVVGGPLEDAAGDDKSLVAHQRSQSLSGLQPNSPKHQPKDKASLPQSTVEAQLRYENDRLKLALAQSSANAKKWEVELQTLKNNNARLTCALQESTSNVEEWKRQLQALKEENTKMKSKVLELEASHGNPDAIAELRKELGSLRNKSDMLDHEVKQKDKEIDALKRKFEDHTQAGGHKVEDRLKMLLTENDGLKGTVSRLQEQLESSRCSAKAKHGALEQLNQRLALKLQELRDVQHEIASMINS